jgi:hypothetical protein
MKLDHLHLYTPKPYWPFNIEKAEQHYNATYLGDFAIKDSRGGWTEEPFAIFWQEKPPVEGYSHYLGLRIDRMTRNVWITGGGSLENLRMRGVVADNDEVIYSRYRHDFVQSSDGSVFIDGGRDYVRMGGKNLVGRAVVDVVFDGPRLVIQEAQLEKADDVSGVS